MVNPDKIKKKLQQNFTFKYFCRSMKLAPVNQWKKKYEKLTANEKEHTKGFYPD